MSQSFGLAAFPMLLVELAPRSVELFLVATEHGRLNDTVRQACDRDATHVRSLLERGAAVEQKISGYQARGGIPYATIEAALEDFYPAVALGSQVPIVVCDVLTEDPGPHADLLAQAQRNRSVSSYPWFIDTVFPMLLRARFEALGLGDIEHPTRVATIDDMTAPDPSKLRARADQVRQGMLHLYQRVDGRARVAMLPSTGFIMARLSGARVPPAADDAGLLRGSAAYAGEVEAVARVVLRPDEPATALADGEVLVTVNANPSFMPFIRRCGALVTDEGGASCHAAIIARELKKPCVMGTGDATRRIRSGQRVRVDAFAQTVTLLD